MYRTAKLSILGMYNYNSEIFKNLTLPVATNYEEFNTTTENVDLQTLIDSILVECADMELRIPNFEVLQHAIGLWSRRHKEEWEKINLSIYIKYNPIHNYNRTEEWEDNEESSSESNDESAGTLNNTSTSKIAGFNSTTLVENGGGVDSGESTQSRNANIESSRNSTHSARIFGNIGVTTSDQMLKQFRETATLNIYDYITRQFKDEFCILVY